MLGVVMIMQEKDPWNINYTLFPILFWVIVLFARFLFASQLPKFIWTRLRNTLCLLLLGAVLFVKGLDDKNDYLRIYHSFWHVFCGITSYMIFQVIEDDSELQKYKKEMIV